MLVLHAAWSYPEIPQGKEGVKFTIIIQLRNGFLSQVLVKILCKSKIRELMDNPGSMRCSSWTEAQLVAIFENQKPKMTRSKYNCMYLLESSFVFVCSVFFFSTLFDFPLEVDQDVKTGVLSFSPFLRSLICNSGLSTIIIILLMTIYFLSVSLAQQFFWIKSYSNNFS